jgi:predicted TIM-barrel fold metal-dependent hydrolase
MISADTHLGPPPTLIRDRIAPEFKNRVPRVERDASATSWLIVEGRRPAKIVDSHLEGEDLYRAKAGSSFGVAGDSNDLGKRMVDLARDGIDAELVFPNGTGLAAFWSPDPALSQAQFRIYNDWAEEVSRPYRQQMNIAACIATADLASATVEATRVAELGFRVITVPTKPIFGVSDAAALGYNHKAFDPFWAVVQDADLTLTFHVATGVDPRGATGPGGAVINFAVHSVGSTADPMACLCASGVLDRFPKLRFAVVESGIGWIPSFLDTMDEAYIKHHMWSFPKLRHGLPSDYFRAHGAATFSEDRSGLALIESFRLTDNPCWANDYPHHEGTFPHSAEAVERQMNDLQESTRSKLLGLNAARLFRFDIPDKYR